MAEDFPRMLMLQTTSACNASCVFCPLPALRRELPQGRMTDALFERLVRQAGEHPQVACINLFLMNEPLCDPQIVERVHLAQRHNPRAQISLWTNAVALTPALSERLLRSPLGSLGVSLHAHRPETYHRVLGRKDLHRVLRNLAHFVEQRLARRPDLAVTLRYIGADLFMSAEEREQALAFWRDAEVDIDLSPGYLSRGGNQEAPAMLREPLARLAGCAALSGPKQVHVLYTGQVVLCCMDYRRTTVLGDASRQPLQQIWQGERRREVLQMLYGARPPAEGLICRRCELAVAGAGEAAQPGPAAPPAPNTHLDLPVK